jgi:hypothetical protein
MGDGGTYFSANGDVAWVGGRGQRLDFSNEIALRYGLLARLYGF